MADVVIRELGKKGGEGGESGPSITIDESDVLKGADHRHTVTPGDSSARHECRDLVHVLLALPGWQRDGPLGEVPQETNVKDGGSEVLALGGDRVPGDAKGECEIENVGKFVVVIINSFA